MKVDREFEETEYVPQPNAIFDESSNFIIYITPLGIKIVNLHTNKVARILGKVENNDRFLRIALYQGDLSSKKVRKIPVAAANVNESKGPLTYPTLLSRASRNTEYIFVQGKANLSNGLCDYGWHYIWHKHWSTVAAKGDPVTTILMTIEYYSIRILILGSDVWTNEE